MKYKIPTHIKAVIFDHDDTLFDTIGTKWDQHKHVAKTFYDLDLTDDSIQEHWGKPLGLLLTLLYQTDDEETAMKHVLATHKDFPKTILPHTKQIIAGLRDSGYLVGLVTATSRTSFEYDLSTNDIALSSFDYTQTAEDTDKHKPDPKVFEPALSWLTEHDIKPSKVLYIGDGLHDMKAALGAGFNFLGAETGLVTREQFAEAGVDSIASLEKISIN